MTKPSNRRPHRVLGVLAGTVAGLGLAGAFLAGSVGAVGAVPGTEPEPEPLTAVIVELVNLGVPGDASVLAGMLEAQTEGVYDTEVIATADVMAAEVDAAGLAALQSSSAVVSVHPARQDLQILLDEAGSTIGASLLHASGFTGEGRVVAVIDSGVDDTHPALAGTVVAEGCFLQGTPSFNDKPGVSVAELCPNGNRTDVSGAPCVSTAPTCTHGTGVAGVIASGDPLLTGIAPDVGILSFRVMAVIEGEVGPGDPEFPYSSYIPDAGVLAALERVYELREKYDIAAVNISLGGTPDDCTHPAWEDVVSRLTDAGIAVVAASGNSGWQSSMTFPACLEQVISVGSTTGAAEIASFTNTSAALDLLAPGSPVETTVVAAFEADGFANLQGTSFSAPQVAAAFALLDEAVPNSWSVSRRRHLLRTTGEMVARVTDNPFDHNPRFPELRIDDAFGFEPFDDAISGYWVDASDWAKYTGVSTGIGSNTFVPNGALTRAQAVTFLWRFMGSPVHGSASGFSDVDESSWYGAAVRWAAATGVTTGTAPGVFSPDEIVSRGQLATFMWRTAGEPSPSAQSGFTDVPSTAYYATSVDWMAEHAITTGTSPATFSPDETITRAQMVTFLHRLADADFAWSGSVAPPDLALF